MSEDDSKKAPPPPDLDGPPASPSIPEMPTPPPPPKDETKSKVTLDERDDEDDQEITEESEDAKPGDIAPLNPRLLAGLIDGLVAGGLSWVGTLIMPPLLDFFVGYVIASAYMISRDSLPFLKGQSIGKTAMNLKVVKTGGGDLVNDWQTAVMRNIMMIIPFCPIVELVILFKKDGQPDAGTRIGDTMGNTKVVVAPSKTPQS